MNYRKLRIAWSVGCGIAVVLVIVLWVRSYWWFDFTRVRPGHFVASWRGCVYFDESMPSISISGFDAIMVRHRLPYFDVHSEWLAAKALTVLPSPPPYHRKALPYPLIVVLVAAI